MTLTSEIPPSPTPAEMEHRAPSRERISQKKRKRARNLEQKLRFLQDEFAESEFFEILQAAITEVHQLAESSRRKDRDRVLISIERTAAHTIEEIMEETHLSYWNVYTILQEFIRLEIVETRTQNDPTNEPLKPTYLYFLTHTPAGSDFVLARHPVTPLGEPGDSFDDNE